jgi:hypothetical protein
MDKPHNEGFYYHAAVYVNFDLAGEVFQALDTLIQSADYNLSVYRCLDPDSQAYCVVVIGERPSKVLDKAIIEHLAGTGELATLSAEVLRDLLARRPEYELNL